MKTGSMVIGCMLTPLTKTFNKTPTPTLSGNVTGNVAYQAAATATTPMVATTCCGVGSAKFSCGTAAALRWDGAPAAVVCATAVRSTVKVCTWIAGACRGTATSVPSGADSTLAATMPAVEMAARR